MIAPALLLACLAGDNARAGSLHDEGKGHLDEARYERAIEAFDAALKETANEGELTFRKQGIVDRKEYHPYFYSGLAYLRHAGTAGSPEEKKRRLTEAENRLKRSIHKDAKARLEEARKELAAVEAKIARPPPVPEPAPLDPFPENLARLKRQLDALAKAENFEAALAELEGSRIFGPGREERRAEERESVRARQAAAVKSRDADLALEMERLSTGDPLDRPDARQKAIAAARLSPEVLKDVPARFRWLDEFAAAWEKERGNLEQAATLDERAVCDVAGAFDRLAGRALEADFLPGFRAARNTAHALRLARLKALTRVSIDVKDKWNRAVLLDAASEESRRVAEEALRSRPEKSDAAAREEFRRYVEETMAGQRSAISGLLETLPRPDMKDRIDLARKGLSDPKGGAEPGRFRGIGADLGKVQADARFGSLPASDQARALFAAAVAEAIAGYLEGEPRERILGKFAPLASRALSLHVKVVEEWGDLPPKIRALIEGARPR